MAFHNRVRLPLNIDRPQYAATREVYTKADGTTKTLSAVLKKTYQGKTDWMPEKWHERLMVALNHDSVVIEGEKYLGGVALDGDSTYIIDWDEIFRTQIAGAKFQVLVTPFDNSNANCMTCDQANQVVLVDDDMPSDLNENTDYSIDVIQNDSICCYPVVFTITSFNSDYLSSCTIDVNGTAHFHTKSGLVEINGLKLFTYRATCSSGGYDEADVFGNINGTVPGCLAPTDLTENSLTQTSIEMVWTPPSPAPDHYFWQLLSSPGGVVLQSGDSATNFVDITGMTASTAYTFQVRSQCDGTDSDGTASNWIQFPFVTAAAATNTCGEYRIFYYGTDPTGHVTYLNCFGTYSTRSIIKLTNENICALQSSPGVFTDISGASISITYVGPC